MDCVLTTESGLKHVRTWGYQLQGRERDGQAQPLETSTLLRAPHDLIVMDFSSDGSGKGAFGKTQVAALKSRNGGNSVVVSYISIGEASDYRDHWHDDWTKWADEDRKAAAPLTDKAPAWLGAWNENWPNSRKVRYWDPDWQKVIFNVEGTGWLDRIVAAGFDGAYLDIVDGYYHWGCEANRHAARAGDPKGERDAAARMIDFLAALARHARQTNPHFLIIPQNGALILDALQDEDPKRKTAYLAAIDAIACEDLFFRGNAPENNAFDPDQDALGHLQSDFIANGRPVFSVDYLNDERKTAEYYKHAVGCGFLPYAAPSRGLDEMGEPYDGAASAIA